MTEPKVDRRKAARDRALASGGIPIDPYPGHLTWFFRECVETGAGSGLNWLCRSRPERETEILDTWCRLAPCEGHLWAWREARSRLEDLVEHGEEVPAPLAAFAIVPPPPAKRGPAPERSRDVVIECMVRGLRDDGFDSREVNAQFSKSFPSDSRNDPGTTLRKRRAKARPFVASAFEPGRGRGRASHQARPKVLANDWSEPVGAALLWLTSGWPAFGIIWELWPEHRDAHLRLWCDRAKGESWVWDELRALLDHAIYCGWSLPPQLRSFVRFARPRNPSHRPVQHGRWLRAAAIEARLAEVVRSLPAARLLVLEAYERARALQDRAEHLVSASFPIEAFADLGLDLDDSTLRKHIISSREQLQGVIAYPQD